MVITQIEELLTKIQQLQSIMIAVATDAYRNPIKEKEKTYIKLYKDIIDIIEFLEEEGIIIENHNPFKSLLEWRDRWSYFKSGYASKAGYIHDLYNNGFNQINIISCQHYIKDKSQEELVDEWQISRFESLIAKIKQLKLTMLSVATQGKPVDLVKSEDEGYKKLYWEVRLQISLLREIGIDALNPNQFQSLWQWYNYWSFELDNVKAVREEHIENLYETLLKTIEKSLKRHWLQKTSLEEFFQDLKRRFNQITYTQTTTDSIIITPNLSNNVQTSNLKLDERFQQPISETVADSFSVPATQAVENSLFTTEYSSLSWTNENVMNPEIFLDQQDVTRLIMALNQFALKVTVANDRQNFLENAGVDFAFLSSLRFDTPPNTFAQSLVSAFKNYQISYQNSNYHPLVNVLKSLCELDSIYGLKYQNVELFTRLVEKGQENFKALAARNTVGRIESPIGSPIGTGVLITKNLLLTCNHIFSKSQVQKAWVRLGYKDGGYESEKNVLELDFVSNNSHLDYALLKINVQTQQKPIFINETSILDSGQDVRIIHHPQGNPVIISDFGQITQVGEDYIDHNVKTDHGSSGAPIFSRQWELIAIHQGNPGIGRSVTPGSTGGIPIRAFWNQISQHLA
ncbi:serine protease [Nostoc sp. CHAB 5836]|uniref:trypsin-like peptidase domain-containing protein n=1 Tax=Nostoc sp. CHAB 5836 TaxID=2780404 RepID=UPI001E396412|nr:trypsin-like peptidase domain-containing protein [Nostoc sp. CHAB 5836]MCC5616576.1 serine protease [Nostoc sp. CHAB 5836]